jgi:hypothetical protein
MAFSYSSEQINVIGIKKMEIISFNAASVTTGTAYTKLSHVDAILINNTTSGVVAGQKAVATGSAIVLSGVNSNDVGDLVVFGY